MIKTKVFKIDPHHPDPKIIERCAAVLKKGGLVALPTETVYGLAANLSDKKAVAKIYKVKKRPRHKPLTIQVSDSKMIEEMGCRIPAVAKKLAKRFWPGPLTLILKGPSDRAFGFRIPKNKVALALIRRAGFPIVVPSANVSGQPPARDSAGVLKDFDGKIDAVIDGGPADIGIESTVVDLTESRVKIARHGAIDESLIARAVRR